MAKCKYHYMEMGRNNMYKPKKQSVVTASFLKVKIMDHFTATYSELSESSVYKDTLEETRRKQNITQGLTDIKDDVLDFFIDIDQNRIKYQNEKMFHIHGSKIINFIHEKLFNSEILFKKFEKLLQDFELNITYARVDDEVARTSLKRTLL